MILDLSGKLRGLGEPSRVDFATTHEAPAPPPSFSWTRAVTIGPFSSEHSGDSHSFGQTGIIHIK